MQTVGFIALHYGSDYLEYVIRAIENSVDHILIAYSSTPSHGHSSTMTNPDTREKCREAAYRCTRPGKINWVDGQWGREGDQRNSVFSIYPNADLVCVVDADEIWHPQEFEASQRWAMQQPVRNIKVSLRTLWRSFNWICDDNMMPDRFYRPNQPASTCAYLPREVGQFYHMGYARSVTDTAYKISTHGHKSEWKANWFEETFKKWSPTNNTMSLHPTCDNTWHAVPFDKNLLPAVMQSHPYWPLEIIQ